MIFMGHVSSGIERRPQHKERVEGMLKMVWIGYEEGIPSKEKCVQRRAQREKVGWI